MKRAGWLDVLLGRRARPPEPSLAKEPLRIGLALGGGFARGIAHAGVLKVFEQNHIPLHAIAGVSAGAIVAAAYASGAIARGNRAARAAPCALQMLRAGVSAGWASWAASAWKSSCGGC